MPNPTLNRVVKDFTCAATSEQTIQLKSLRGKKVVIWFYPKDATPGCTTEGQGFRDNYTKFKNQNTVILGVSKDSLNSHEKFKEKQKFQFDLISDPDEKLCNQFGVIKEKNMYGKKYLGIERSTFLIDEYGKLRQEWRKVKVAGHVDEVLETVKNI